MRKKILICKKSLLYDGQLTIIDAFNTKSTTENASSSVVSNAAAAVVCDKSLLLLLLFAPTLFPVNAPVDASNVGGPRPPKRDEFANNDVGVVDIT